MNNKKSRTFACLMEHFAKLLPKGEYRLVCPNKIFEEYLEYGIEAQQYAAYGYFKIK